MSTSLFPPPASLGTPDIGSSRIDSAYSHGSVATDREAKFLTWSNSDGKRLFDLAVSASLLTALSPALVLIGAAVRLSSHGPVFFRQTRMGRDEVPFTIYKFRTMYVDQDDSLTVTRRGDSRLTRLGGLLRKLKLDELPQLYNVIRGEMSMVGPRPKIVGHDKLPLPCKPGVTGKATLMFRNEEELLSLVPADEVVSFMVDVLNPIKAQLDHQYAKESTLRSDLGVMVYTAVRRRGTAIRSLDELAKYFPQISSEPAPVTAEKKSKNDKR